MKSIIEKAGGARRFVSPSFITDIQRRGRSESPFNWKEAAGLAFSAWSIKRYPKVTILGLLAAGIYIGMHMKKDKHPFHGNGIVKDLH